MNERPIEFYSDGLRLEGTLYLPDDLRPGERRSTVVACSGYLGLNAIYPRLFAQPLTEAGYVVVGFDYRGNAGSDGTPGRIVIQEQVRDIRSAVTFAREQPEVVRDRIALVGWGMGAGAVIQLAAFDRRVGAVAAVNGFYDGRSFLLARHGEDRLAELLEKLEADRVARTLTGKGHFNDPYEVYPLDPDTRAEVEANLDPVPGFGPPTAFELLESILSLDAEAIVHKVAPRPLLIAHGEHNRLHPFEDALSVYGRAERPKRFHRIAGKHNDFMKRDHPEFERLVGTVTAWLEATLVARRTTTAQATG